MAASSASRSWAKRALVTGAAVAVGLLAFAMPASAHTGVAVPGCDKKTDKAIVSVKLTAYLPQKDGKTNTIEVFEVAEGKDVLIKKEDFGVSLDKTYGQLDGKVAHTFKVIVTAWDDPDFKHGFSKKWTDLKTPVCDKTPPTKPTKPTSPPSSSSSAPAPVPQPGVPPAQPPATGGLADTGASIGIPLAIGALLLVGGGVLLLVMRKRGQA